MNSTGDFWLGVACASGLLLCGCTTANVDPARADLVAKMRHEAREVVGAAPLLCRGKLPVVRRKSDYLTHSLWLLGEVEEGRTAAVGREVCERVSWQAGVFLQESRLSLFADGFDGRVGSNIVARQNHLPETLVETCAGRRLCEAQDEARAGEWLVTVSGVEKSREWMKRFCEESLCSGSYVELLGFQDGTGENELLLHGSPEELRKACLLAVDGGVSLWCPL